MESKTVSASNATKKASLSNSRKVKRNVRNSEKSLQNISLHFRKNKRIRIIFVDLRRLTRSAEKTEHQKLESKRRASLRRIGRTALALEKLVSNDLLEARDSQFSAQEFCEICKSQQLKSFLLSLKQKKKHATIDPKRFLLLREFFLESYDKKLFNECKETWSALRVFDVLRFLVNYESFKKNRKLEREIRRCLQTKFGMESRKVLHRSVSSEFGEHTTQLKKNLLSGLKSRKNVEDFEEKVQNIFLKEFGIILEIEAKC